VNRVKKLTDRALPEHSQTLRLVLQVAFIALNVWIGIAFYRWVRWIEDPQTAAAVARPAGVEGWLPIAGLMNLKVWLTTWNVPEVHPAAMVLLAAFLVMSLLLKKAFCSWLCPIGTLSEMLWKFGRRVAGENIAPPKWVDIPLRALKYVLLGFFAWVILQMPAAAIEEFMRAPFGIVADIRMLDFFRHMSVTALVIVAVLIALSVAIRNFWCRYLCPYGALLGIAALFSPTAITRDADACIDCAKCAKACPSRLPVDVLPQVRSAECTLCMSCVAVCPARGALEVKVLRKKRLPGWAVAAGIAVIFFGAVFLARVTGHWEQSIPDETVRMFLTIVRR
jgi:polyferredoxin